MKKFPSEKKAPFPRKGCGAFVIDAFVKSPKMPFSVIPVKTGIQSFQALLDSRLSILRSRATAEDGRGSDDCGDFLRDHLLLAATEESKG